MPTEAEFAGRGLYEVELAPSGSGSASAARLAACDRETRTTGRALFKPVAGHPLARTAAGMLGPDGTLRVRFRCVETDLVGCAHLLMSPLLMVHPASVDANSIAPSSNPAGECF